MRELAHHGHRVEEGEDYHGAWIRLGETHPLMTFLIESYYQLLSLGYIVSLPQGNQAPNPNFLNITERGKQWVSFAGPVPEDADGFLAALNTLIPTLDPVVKQYVAEAVVTYNRQAWFAAAVMVGAASEMVVYMLADALLNVTGGKDQRALEKAIKERNIPNLFEQLNKVLTSHIESDSLPYEIHEGSEPHLMSLFEAIRVQRNEAVHPTVGEVTPTTVRLTLSAFPSACRKCTTSLAGVSRTRRAAPRQSREEREFMDKEAISKVENDLERKQRTIKYERALGQMSIRFSLLHAVLEELGWKIWGLNKQVGPILTKNLPIKQLVKKIRDSTVLFLPKDVSAELNAILNRVEKAADRRMNSCIQFGPSV
jgi:hypothetical protein